jgi:hypothetical protein
MPKRQKNSEVSMRNRIMKTFTGSALAVVMLAGIAAAQAPAPAAAPTANPSYVSILLQADINKPATDVWKRIGKYCDISEWLGLQCTISAGKDGELGAVRSLGAIGTEILVGKTDLSYTYAQPARPGQFYNLYHGTVEVKPVTATTSRLVYSLVWDNSNLADDAAKERDKTQRTTTFQRAVDNMKILAEGGTLPPAAPRGGGGRGAGAPGGPPAGGPGARQ